jgi:hypothetical protein
MIDAVLFLRCMTDADRCCDTMIDAVLFHPCDDGLDAPAPDYLEQLLSVLARPPDRPAPQPLFRVSCVGFRVSNGVSGVRVWVAARVLGLGFRFSDLGLVRQYKHLSADRLGRVPVCRGGEGPRQSGQREGVRGQGGCG